MSLSGRLAELGIALPPVPRPVAAYVPAVRAGNLVFSSGQPPFVDGALAVTGRVGSAVTEAEATDAARTAALNALAALPRERAWTLYGMENLLMAMVADQEFAHRLLDRILEHNLAIIEHACSQRSR